jgi:hypothetical protein
MADRTPREWLDFLEARLEARRPAYQTYEDYYEGRHPLAFATSKFREAFGDLFSEFADNFMQLVVDVPVDRLHIEGFDFGNERTNRKAWQLWRASSMESRSLIAHTEAVKNGTAFALVDPSGRVTVESPLQCYVETDPADPLLRVAGIKKWIDDVQGLAFANVYLDDAVYKFQAQVTVTPVPYRIPNPIIEDWEPRADEPEVANPFGVVPLIPLENNPTLLVGGRSDLDVAIPLQNVTNKLVTDMVVASDYQAFKQRVLLGVEVPKDPDTDEPLDSAQLMAAITRTWFVENENASVVELQGSDLAAYVSGVEMSIMHMATKVRIPPQYFLANHGTLANVSADAMGVVDSGFIAKVERKQGDFGPAWREVSRLQLHTAGIEVSPDEDKGLPVWRAASPPQAAALADAMVKYRSLGVPLEWIWQQVGATPEQQVEWRTLLDAQEAKDAEAAAQAQAAQADAAAKAAAKHGTPSPDAPPPPPHKADPVVPTA